MTARVIVAGGGISGLAAAHALAEPDGAQPRRDVLLLEAGARAGGSVRSFVRDGFLIEEGADSMITDKPWGRMLAERLGIAARIIATQERHRRSFVLHRGRLRPVPAGFHLLTPARLWPAATSGIFSPAGLLRMALEPLVPARRDEADESIGAFVRRRLGREALERIAAPMVAGIYGADVDDLSLQATLPRFALMEREHGSLLRAMAAGAGRAPASGARYGLFMSFDAGMQVLVDAIGAALPPGCLRTHTTVRALARDARGWRVATDAGEERCDAVVLALPAAAAAALLAPLDAGLSADLAAIPAASAATVSLGFRADQIGHPLDGFGFVARASGVAALLGCTFAHRKYAGRAPGGHALLRAYLGSDHADVSDADVVEMSLAGLRPLLSIRGAPLLAHVARHAAGIPRYPSATWIASRASPWPPAASPVWRWRATISPASASPTACAAARRQRPARCTQSPPASLTRSRGPRSLSFSGCRAPGRRGPGMLGPGILGPIRKLISLTVSVNAPNSSSTVPRRM